MAKQSFLFIPDISGFTEFVNSTEIEHGQHIISELLEGIIESNTLGLEVSEVEGDAVLFYKHRSIPSYSDLVKQVESTFIDFHERIKKFESLRICTCGACTNTINLTLKVISHIGEIGFTHVHKRQKPYGADLVRVHRMLKNNIPENEYLLMSDELARFYQKDIANWSDAWPELIEAAVPDGNSVYRYAPLTPLKSKVKAPKVTLTPPLKVAQPRVVEVKIGVHKEKVFSMILSFDNRALWNKGTKKIMYDKSRVNRKGARHDCILQDDTLIQFETIAETRQINALVYGERVLGSKIAKELAIYFVVSAGETPNESIVKAEIHVTPLPIVGWMIKPLILKKMSEGIREQLDNLKIICEQEAQRESQPLKSAVFQ
ncbi:MAG: DUF2652 domain-containing protein [Cyclobacteriaceae bacterium]